MAETLSESAIVTPKNDDTLILNNTIVQKLPGQPQMYLSVDRAVCDDEAEALNYPSEFLNSITPSGMPPIDFYWKQELCNGTQLIVRRLHRHSIDAEFYRVLTEGIVF